MLRHERLPVAALPLVLQEIGLLEELLLVELELPHLSIEAAVRELPPPSEKFLRNERICLKKNKNKQGYLQMEEGTDRSLYGSPPQASVGSTSRGEPAKRGGARHLSTRE